MTDLTKTGQANVPMPLTMIEDLRALADANERSVAAEIRVAVRAHLDRQDRERAA